MADITAARIVIPVSTNANGAIRELGNLNIIIKNTTDSAKRAQQGFGGFGGILKAAIFSQAAQRIFQLGKALNQAASNAEETQNKFTVVFRGINKEAQATADALAKNFGLSSRASQQLLSDTGDLLTGFGFSRQEALKLSNQVQMLAVDLASFTNYSGGAEGASRALTSGLLGEREAMKALGIAIDEDDIKLEALNRGLDPKNLTRQEQAAITLAIAMKQSGNAIGDFARSNLSFANQARIAQANTENLKVSLGKGLLPFVNAVTVAFNDSSKGVQAWADNLVGLVSEVETAQTIGSTFGDVVASLGFLLDTQITFLKSLAKDVIKPIIAPIKDFAKETSSAMLIVNIALQGTIVYFKIFGEVAGYVVNVLLDLVSAAIESGKVLKKLGDYTINRTNENFQELVDQTDKTLSAWKQFGKSTVGDLGTLGKNIYNEISKASDEIAKKQEASAKKAEETTKRISKSFVDNIKGSAKTMGADDQTFTSGGAKNVFGNEDADDEFISSKKDKYTDLQDYLDDQSKKAYAERKLEEEELTKKIQSEVDKRKATIEDYANKFSLITENLMGTAQAFTEVYNNGLKSEIESIKEKQTQQEESATAEIEALQAKGATAAEISDAEARAKRDKAKLDAELKAKELELRQKEAKQNKAFGIFQAGIDTAIGIANALTLQPTPFGIATSILVGIKGAAQIAAISSTPIPQAQFGGDFSVPTGATADSGLLRVNQGETVSVTPVRNSESSESKRMTLVIGERDFEGFLTSSLNRILNSGNVRITRKGVVTA